MPSILRHKDGKIGRLKGWPVEKRALLHKTIFSETFDTDPFSRNWTQYKSSGEGEWRWTEPGNICIMNMNMPAYYRLESPTINLQSFSKYVIVTILVRRTIVETEYGISVPNVQFYVYNNDWYRNLDHDIVHLRYEDGINDDNELTYTYKILLDPRRLTSDFRLGIVSYGTFTYTFTCIDGVFIDYYHDFTDYQSYDIDLRIENGIETGFRILNAKDRLGNLLIGDRYSFSINRYTNSPDWYAPYSLFYSDNFEFDRGESEWHDLDNSSVPQEHLNEPLWRRLRSWNLNMPLDINMVHPQIDITHTRFGIIYDSVS